MGMTNVLNMLCGLALFLYGMHVMGEGLTRASGGKLEGMLEKLTKSKLKAVLVGAAVTAVCSSCRSAAPSSAGPRWKTEKRGARGLRVFYLQSFRGYTPSSVSLLMAATTPGLSSR